MALSVPAGLFLGDGVLPLPQRLMRKILALDFIEMRELLPEEWVTASDQDDGEAHSCCNSAARKRRAPVTNIFAWLQAYSTLVGALSTTYPTKVPELMAYQSTVIRCYRDFEGAAWVQYDRAYRRQAAVSRDLNWSRINTTLYSLCFAGRAKRNNVCAFCLSNNHPSERCPEAPMQPAAQGRPSPAPSGRETCRLFNARGGSRCHFASCRFAHVCMKCKGDHQVSACLRAGGGPGRDEGTKRPRRE